MKKAQGLSINMIIIIVIALLVLVIVLVSLFRSSDGFSESTSCVAQGGRCSDNCNNEFWSTGDRISDAQCPDPDKSQCCRIGNR